MQTNLGRIRKDVYQVTLLLSIRTLSDVAHMQAGGTQVQAAGKVVAASTAAYLRDWLPGQLLETVFRMTREVSQRVHVGAAAPEAQFPRLPGSHLTAAQLGSPALAFVRTLCHVLALDASVPDEVRSLPSAPHSQNCALLACVKTVHSPCTGCVCLCKCLPCNSVACSVHLYCVHSITRPSEPRA